MLWTTIWFLNMVKVQMLFMVVELLWWEKCSILVEVVLRNDTYESFILTGFELFFQMSKIEGCQLVQQGDLSFDFYAGSCNTFIIPTQRILLCFNYAPEGTKTCHTWVLWYTEGIMKWPKKHVKDEFLMCCHLYFILKNFIFIPFLLENWSRAF